MTTECETMTARVVLVEDSPEVRYLLGHALEADGRFEIVGEAATAEAGLSCATTLEPDVVLVDLLLGTDEDDRDGSWLLTRLRQALPRTPLVAVTGSADPAVQAAALEAGADSVLVKRDLTSTLIDRIHEVTRYRPAGG